MPSNWCYPNHSILPSLPMPPYHMPSRGERTAPVYDHTQPSTSRPAFSTPQRTYTLLVSRHLGHIHARSPPLASISSSTVPPEDHARIIEIEEELQRLRAPESSSFAHLINPSPPISIGEPSILSVAAPGHPTVPISTLLPSIAPLFISLAPHFLQSHHPQPQVTTPFLTITPFQLFQLNFTSSHTPRLLLRLVPSQFRFCSI